MRQNRYVFLLRTFLTPIKLSWSCATSVGEASEAACGTPTAGPPGHAPPEKAQAEASTLPYITLKSTKSCQTQQAKQSAQTKPADPPSSLLAACLCLHLHILQHHLNPVEAVQLLNKQAEGTDGSGDRNSNNKNC